MNRALIRSVSVSLALLSPIPLAEANDLNLLGCWRSQNMDQYLSDEKIIHTNNDCVAEFSLREIRSECQNASGRVNILSTYEITAPGRYVATLSQGSAAAREPPQPRVFEYVVDGEWLTLTSFPQIRANAQSPAIDKFVGLAVRVNTPSGKDTCQPRGPSKIRVGGRAVDPFGPLANPHLEKAINFSFLIGQFVPAGSEKVSEEAVSMPGGRYVLVVEDYRVGSRPMRPADFRQYKASIKQDIGQDKVSCEDEKRLCFSTAHSEDRVSNQPSQVSGYMTTEFVNLKGRVAIIYGVATGGTPEDSKAARRSADIFAAQIVY